MSLFGTKKKVAIAMFGNQYVLDTLVSSNIFASAGITLLEHDYVTVDEVIAEIRKNKSAEYLIISDQSLIGMERGKYEAIRRIRAASKDIFIVMLMSEELPDEEFHNWAFGHAVYNIYYAAPDGSFNFGTIISEIAEKKMPQTHIADPDIEKKERELKLREEEIASALSDMEKREEHIRNLEAELKKEREEIQNKKEISADIDNEAEERMAALSNELDSERNKLRSAKEEFEKMKSIEEERIAEAKRRAEEEIEEGRRRAEEKIAEANRQAEEKIAEANRQAEEKIAEANKQAASTNALPTMQLAGCIQIGVFSVSRGAGATRMTAELAERYARAGYKTAAIAYDGNEDLSYINGKADYYFPTIPEKKSMLVSLIAAGYDFIIIDFGCLFPVTNRGIIDSAEKNQTNRDEDIQEFYRCNFKVAVAFSDIWNAGKLNFFANENAGFGMSSVFAITEISNIKGLINDYPLVMCERDSETVFSVLLEMQGLVFSKSKTKERMAASKKLFNRSKEREVGVQNGN